MPPARNIQAPTVNDLRVKLCYICQDEELYNEPSQPPKAWVHPCNCTLVAHEECLLKWIQASKTSKQSLECPQCKAKYVIESDRPLIYQLLDAGNQTLNTVGTFTLVAGVAAVCGLIGTSVYIVCTGYGAWAVEKFVGKELYQLCYGDDPARWPWTAYLNLPLVPFSLVLSRFPFTSGLLCSFPIFIAWPRHSNNRLAERWSHLDDTRLLPSPPSYWPPTPFLFAAFGVPVIRSMYSVAYKAPYRKVMGHNPPQETIILRNGLRMNAGAGAQMVVRVRHEGDAPANADRNQEGQAQAADGNGGEQGQENVLDVKISAVGRRIASGLMVPLLANYMGRLLFHVSRHSTLLKTFLGIKRTTSMGWLPTPVDGRKERGWSVLGQVNGLRTLMDVLSGGLDAPMDPVWWRNTVGLGLFVVKDCVNLLYMYLAKKELESRHVKSKDFRGIDIQTLDLVPDFFTRR
ncbi:hypothetical protein BKA70DRAFT_1422813 [Coprinopsis sp. MPI-PUGE-AT-0042]|nr:hypothetical protein BKA70DRAFT_1422813 [Coprinopsis sp. MPI-PUGE-AT-0042]